MDEECVLDLFKILQLHTPDGRGKDTIMPLQKPAREPE
jgi:hypothetical protein